MQKVFHEAILFGEMQGVRNPIRPRLVYSRKHFIEEV